jgi:hypothetical protein
MIHDDETMANIWWSVGAWRNALYKYYNFDEDTTKIEKKLLLKAIMKATDSDY